ncbi:MAG: hypothetical protein K2X44_03920, partial [Magnetospirillum sp.]|nr:hypothetical protein [Magnetospirillum sp.]
MRPAPLRSLPFYGLVALAALIPLVIGLWHGLNRPYAITPDADIIYMGEALRSLDGRPYFYT